MSDEGRAISEPIEFAKRELEAIRQFEEKHGADAAREHGDRLRAAFREHAQLLVGLASELCRAHNYVGLFCDLPTLGVGVVTPMEELHVEPEPKAAPAMRAKRERDQ